MVSPTPYIVPGTPGVLGAPGAPTLVRICDPAGRPCGAGCPTDHEGTVLTSHEAVAVVLAAHGRLLLRLPDGAARMVPAERVLPLPAHGLALILPDGSGAPLGVPPLPLASGRRTRLVGIPVDLPPGGAGTRHAGSYAPGRAVGYAPGRAQPFRGLGGGAGGTGGLGDRGGARGSGAPAEDRAAWEGGDGGSCPDGGQLLLPGGVLPVAEGDAATGKPTAGGVSASDAGTGRGLARVWRIELGRLADGRSVPCLLPESTGTPVLDAETGAVVAVLSGGPHGVAGYPYRPPAGAARAVPLGSAWDVPELAEAVARNAATVPAFGRALNPAGILELTDAQLHAAVAGAGTVAEAAALRAPRSGGLPEVYAEWTGDGPVLPVIGAPGTGRTTELAALAAARSAARPRLPTLWLRGADLTARDDSLGSAVGRVLRHAAGLLRIGTVIPGAGAIARLSASAGRPLLIVLDAPEEMPPGLVPVLDRWLRGTADWLRGARARLVVGCTPEFWERAGGVLDPGAAGGPAGTPRVWLGDRAHPHPPVDRLLDELRGELPELDALPEGARPGRGQVFEAWTDLRCLRIAQRLALGPVYGDPPWGRAERRRGVPPPAPPRNRGERTRRLAIRAAGRVHEAARRMVGPGQGALSRADFEEIFPAADGWAQAVLAERLFVPAGDGFRIGDEELSEWLQSAHLDLPAAFAVLLGDGEPGGGEAPGAAPGAAPDAATGVPRWRCGVVAWALLRLGERDGAAALDPWLARLAQALDLCGEPRWWAACLLSDVLLRLPDASAHLPLLTALAERLVRAPEGGGAGEGEERFGAGFWARLRLPVAARVDLLRPAVRAGFAAGVGVGVGVAETLDGLIAEQPAAAFAALARWLADADLAPTAEQRLWARRGTAVDEVVEALVAAAHPRADALLARLAEAEPSALCRAIDRWAHDPRPERHVAAAAHALPTARALAERAAALGAPPSEPPAGGPAPSAASAAARASVPGAPPDQPLAASGPAGSPAAPAAARASGLGPDQAPPAEGPAGGPDPAQDGAPPAARAAALGVPPDQAPASAPVAEAAPDGEAAPDAGAAPPAARALGPDEGPVAAGSPARPTGQAPEGAGFSPGGFAAVASRGGERAQLGADRALLRFAAGVILDRPGEEQLHGAVLAALMYDPDPEGRQAHLAEALRRYRDGDPLLPAAALLPALDAHPAQVADAFGARMRAPGAEGRRAAEEVLAVLGGATAPHARVVADRLVLDHLARDPAAAARVAELLDARLRLGPAARADLVPLVRRIVREHGAAVRRALVPVLARPEPPLRQELLDELLAAEDDEDTLELVLDRVAAADAHLPARVRQIVRAVAPRLDDDRLDLRLVRCARGLPRFAALLAEWLAEEPDLPPGPRTARMRELLEAGIPAQRAAAGAEEMTAAS